MIKKVAGGPGIDFVVIKIQRLENKRPLDEVFADVRGKVVFHEDPDEPTTEEWEAV